MADPSVTTEYLAARLRVDPQTVRRWARSGWRGPDGQALPGVVEVVRGSAGDYRFRLAPELDRCQVLTMPELAARLGMDARTIRRQVAVGALDGVVVAIYHFPRTVRVVVRGKAPAIPLRGDARMVHWDSQPLGQVSDREIARKLRVSSSAVRLARVSRGIPAWDGPRGRKRLA